ncbi:hypothetical protein Drorol1_Dr00008415 [Drosera rotundifolia]
MGNAFRSLFRACCSSGNDDAVSGPALGPHGVNAETVGLTALAHDLLLFEVTSQVPPGLHEHVKSSRKAQANWYRKLLVAWKECNPPPKTPEEAARLMIETLKRHRIADVEGLLAFYCLPLPHSQVQLLASDPSRWPDGVKFEFHTLPVDAKAVADGDTITVYVSTADPRESSSVPQDVQIAAIQRAQARAERNYDIADALHQSIVESGYRVLTIQNEDVLARKYRIRLRAIDAPEIAMPYGKEAKEELAKLVQGRSLKVLVYGEDRYGRSVADIYCNNRFAQEVMLKKGLAWHYAAYDKRIELANWEKEARARRVGLWAAANPEEPWEWRKERRERNQT